MNYLNIIDILTPPFLLYNTLKFELFNKRGFFLPKYDIITLVKIKIDREVYKLRDLKSITEQNPL